MSRQVEAMRALLNHKDPTVAAQGRQMVKTSSDPAVRALHNNSRAAAPCVSGGPSRADRAAKPASTKQGATAVVATRAGEERRTRPGNPNRFAHFAGMTSQAPIADGPAHADATPTDAAAFIMASAAKARGQKIAAAAKPSAAAKADMTTPEGVAAFVAASAAKARGARR